MNMISTGAFQNEMDASSKQSTLAKKFAAVWEKKNAKAARAGGVSLMALSLAACGSDDSTTTTTTSSTDTTTTTTTPTAITAQFTTAIDALVGGGAADTFIGDSNVVTAADSADGGAGSDTLKMYSSAVLPNMTSIENLEIHNVSPGSLDLSGTTLSQVTSLLVDGFTVAGQSMTIKAGDTIALTDVTGAGADFIVTAAAGVTSATVSVDGSGDATAGAIDLQFNGAGFATLNIDSSGTASRIDIDTVAATTTVDIDAAGALVIENIEVAKTIDASGSTASVEINAVAATDATVTLGSGDDILDMGTGISAKDVLDGGAGTDTLSLTDAGAAGSAASISNFEILELNGAASQTVDIDTEFAGFTQFIVSGNTTGAATYKIDDAASGSSVTLMTVDADTTASDDVNVTLATDGTADSLSFVVGNGKTDVTFDGLDANDAETVNIDITAASATDSTAAHAIGIAGAQGVNFTDATKVVVTGSGNAAFADIEMKAADHEFDASAATGNLTLGFTTTGQDQTIKGGSGKDTITMDDLDNDDVVDGGAGADSLTSGIETTLPTLVNVANVETVKLRIADPTAAQTSDFRLATGMTDLHIIGTAATDENLTLNGLGAGVTVRFESLDETAGGDTHAVNYVSGVTSAALVMDEFGDSDAQSHSLTIDSQITTVTISTDDAEANISTLTGTGMTALTLAVGTTDGAGFDIDSLAAVALETLTITASTDKNITIDGGTTDNSLKTIDASGVDTGNDGEADVVLGSGASLMDRADDATVTLGHGNDTLSFDVGQHGANVIDADKGSDTLSMGGTQSGNIVIDLSSTTDQITTLNGVGNTAVQKGFESVDLSSVTVSSGSATITGSSTAGTLTGSSANDTITGGTAADTITGGTGADTMTGGATGLDTFVIAAGDSVITIGGSGDAGTIAGMDSIMDFADGTASANSETLNVQGTASIGNATDNGTDSTLTVGGVAIKSATEATGLVVFDDSDNHTATLTIDSLADVAAAIQYCQAQDWGNAGATIMFNVADDTFGADAGTVTEAVVFTQGSDAGTDNTLDTVTFLYNVGTVTDVITTNASTAGAVFVA